MRLIDIAMLDDVEIDYINSYNDRVHASIITMLVELGDHEAIE